MSLLTTDPKKLNLNNSLENNFTLPKVDSHLSLPKVAGSEESKIVFVAQQGQGSDLKNDVKKLLTETKPENIGTNKDSALSLLREKVKDLENKVLGKQEPSLSGLKIDDDLKSRLDALTENIQNGGSFNEIKKFQDREQGIVPKTQVDAAKALLEVAEKLGQSSIGKDKKILSPIYEQIAGLVEPGVIPEATFLSKESLGVKINELNNQVENGKVLQEMLKANPGKWFDVTEKTRETVQLLVLTAEKSNSMLSKSLSADQKKVILAPFLDKIGESLLAN